MSLFGFAWILHLYQPGPCDNAGRSSPESPDQLEWSPGSTSERAENARNKWEVMHARELQDDYFNYGYNAHSLLPPRERKPKPRPIRNIGSKG